MKTTPQLRALMFTYLVSRLPETNTEKVRMFIDSLDVITLCRTAQERFELRIWDGGPINGMSRAEMAKLGMPLPDGSAFVIRDKRRSRDIQFQTFDPKRSGHLAMTRKRAELLGTEMLNSVIQNSVFEAAYKLAKEAL